MVKDKIAGRKIAILESKSWRGIKAKKMMTLLKKQWMEMGAEIIDIYGPETFIPADLVIMHVDLSVVPIQYKKFADLYPLNVNANVLDIRKSVICDHLLSANDSYTGPVIVKSDLHSAGIPEKIESRFNRSVWERFPLMISLLVNCIASSDGSQEILRLRPKQITEFMTA